MVILWGSSITAGIIGNIPYTIAVTPIVGQIQAEFGASYTYPIWWALALGACLGGNLTIIGAAANVIVAETAGKDGYNISFMKFFKYGSLITFVGIFMSAPLYLYLKFLI
jgi:Na+/H+ antiporter NhaD/arsenite permease-like protein